MLVQLVRLHPHGLVVRRLIRRACFTVAFGEILSAERARSGLGLRLHTRTAKPLLMLRRRKQREALETQLRACGVRIVDCWGAIIAPTLADFQDELAREPVRVGQSSDNA